MEIKLYEIEEYFQKKPALQFSPYIQEKIETMGTNLYTEMKKFYDSKEEDIPTNHYIYLLQDKTDIVGFRYFYLNSKTNFSELFAIAVDPSYRKKGYAKEMIEKSIEFLISQGVKKIKVPLIKSSEAQIVLLKDYYLNSIQQKYNNIDWEIHVSEA
jgi:GNAT superfamily N-acetyltransferase